MRYNNTIVNAEARRYGRKQLWSVARYFPDICMEILRKAMKRWVSIRICMLKCGWQCCQVSVSRTEV